MYKIELTRSSGDFEFGDSDAVYLYLHFHLRTWLKKKGGMHQAPAL